eukprot:363640-Chlamydomonas_euryale.AAC.2
MTLSIPHGFQCSKLCWEAEQKHYQAGTKSIESRLLGAFCMGRTEPHWRHGGECGCMELMGYMGLNGVERGCMGCMGCMEQHELDGAAWSCKQLHELDGAAWSCMHMQ